MKHFRTLILALLCMVAGTAWAESTWTVTNNNNMFTITRSDGTYAQKVRFRTVNLSAYAGQNYSAVDMEFTFDKNITSTTVTVSEYVPGNAYSYYNGSTDRKYRFEVTDRGGFTLASADRTMDNGISVNKTNAFAEQSVTVNSGTITVTHNNYSQAYHAVPMKDYYTAAAAKNYLVSAGVQLRMTLNFQAKEKDDGYQHVQILVNQTSNHDEGSGNNNPGTMNYSSYMACFCHAGGSKNTTYSNYVFPDVNHGNNCGNVGKVWSSINSTNDVGELRQQYFNTNCRASDGKLIIADVNASGVISSVSGLTTLGIRFDGSGENEDTWYAYNTVAKIQAIDLTNPTKSAVSVNPGRHAKGNTFYVSVAFSEIVSYSGTRKLITSWGDLNYVAGDGTNVLTFSGVIPQDATEKLSVTSISGTIKDLAGKSLSGSVTASNLCSLDGDLTYALNDFYIDGSGNYLIACHDDLWGLAGYVNGGGETSGKTFLQVTDISYSHTGLGDTENNFTAIGGRINNINIYFRGTFDGQGHTISGIRIYKSGTTEADNYQGLFGMAADATIKNVILANARITGKQNVGGIAGYISKNSPESQGGIVENCRVGSDVTIHTVADHAYRHGGVVGDCNDGTIRGCVSAATLTIASNFNYEYIANYGGIVGSLSGNMSDCLAIGTTVPAVSDYYGAIAGSVYTETSTQTNCYYLNCTVAGASESNIYAITLGTNVILNRTASATLPGTNNRTYTDGATIGGTEYYVSGATIPLGYSGTVNTGYHLEYSATAGTLSDNTLTMPSEAVTVSVTVPANSYTVHFEKNHDDATGEMSDQAFTYDAEQPLTSNAFARIGYTFSGWNTQADGNGNAYSNEQEVGNLTATHGGVFTLYAQWTANQYIVTLDNQNATSAGSTLTIATYDSAMPPIPVPTRTGYTFGGYYTETNGGGTQFYNADGTSAKNWDITAATILYAKWTAITYTVHFDGNGSTDGTMADQNFTYDEAQKLTANAFTRIGYTFTGWYYNNNTYSDQQEVSNLTATDGATITLYAQWHFLDGGGNELNPFLIHNSDELLKLADRTNNGTKFTNAYFQLKADIDMDGITWSGIGEFSGTFDGAGHTISNVTINRPDGNFVGLFRSLYNGVGKNCAVKNLILDGATITGNNSVGAIVGTLTSTPAIENCVVLNANVTVTHPEGIQGGIIAGIDNFTGTNNYYYNCSLTIGGETRTSNIGAKNSDCDGAKGIYQLTPGSVISVSRTGGTALNSNITLYADGATIGGNEYYVSGTNITVSVSPVPGVDIPSVTYNDGSDHNATDNGNGTWSFQMPATDATVSATLSVDYIDADGTEKTRTDFTLIQSSDREVTLGTDGEEHWFVVSGNVNITNIYSGALSFYGAARLILCDGATLTLSGSLPLSVDGNLVIYRQSQGTGSLKAEGSGTAIRVSEEHNTLADNGTLTINGGSITAHSTNSNGINASKSVTINGGTVSATGDNQYSDGISSVDGDVTINGGSVSATGGERGYGIKADGNITLGWTRATDRIYASSYFTGTAGTIVVKSGQTLTDGTNSYSGTLTSTQVSDIAGLTLRPEAVVVPDLTVSNVTATTAYATWTACDGISTYTLQLASDDQFTTGGTSGGSSTYLINESFENGSNPDGWPDGWTHSGNNISISNINGPGYGDKCVAFSGKGAYLITPLVENPSNVSFEYVKAHDTSSGTVWSLEVSYSTSTDGPWTNIETIEVNDNVTVWVPYSMDINIAGSVYIKFTDVRQRGSAKRYIDLIQIKGTSGGNVGTGSLIGEYSVTGTSYTFTGLTPNTTYFARVKGCDDWSNVVEFQTTDVTPVNITLVDNASDNSSIIGGNDGAYANVTLQDRTLWKDGDWNTLCLPFNLPPAQVTAQLAPAALMTLSSSSFDSEKGTLTLNFEDATMIEAGKPYIIKWTKPDGYTVDGDFDLVNPVFTGVTISDATANVSTTYVDFLGTYNPVTYANEDKSILFLGAENKLYYPNGVNPTTIKSCRAYFHIGNPNAVKEFRMNFGEDEADGIGEVESGKLKVESSDGAWYTLDGRKLAGKPTARGIYIINGKKILK